MSTTEKKISAQVGDVLTALSTVTVPDPAGGVSGINLQRASTITVTASFVEDTTDRTGYSWLSDLSDEAQIRRWGEQRFVVGDLSGEIFWWENSSASAKLAYDLELHNASLIADPEAGAEAVTAVRKKFQNAGLNPSNQVVTMRLAPNAENIYSPKDDR